MAFVNGGEGHCHADRQASGLLRRGVPMPGRQVRPICQNLTSAVAVRGPDAMPGEEGESGSGITSRSPTRLMLLQPFSCSVEVVHCNLGHGILPF